jgi:hypothetical protein
MAVIVIGMRVSAFVGLGCGGRVAFGGSLAMACVRVDGFRCVRAVPSMRIAVRGGLRLGRAMPGMRVGIARGRGFGYAMACVRIRFGLRGHAVRAVIHGSHGCCRQDRLDAHRGWQRLIVIGEASTHRATQFRTCGPVVAHGFQIGLVSVVLLLLGEEQLEDAHQHEVHSFLGTRHDGFTPRHQFGPIAFGNGR